jgi:hypothetical protein
MQREERNLRNPCHRRVDFQSLSYLSRSLRTDLIAIEPKRKEMRMRAGKEGRMMKWIDGKRGKELT